ncbi:MAG: LytR/AlgR family response regulator transcription factor [Flammeovirgaceae bacterium]
MIILIVDDNANMRSALKTQLAQLRVGYEHIYEAGNVASGLQAIQAYHPDLVFLDVEMPDGTGMDLLQQVTHHHFQLIFITAFDHYAIEGFKFSAIDFLLKPIQEDQLIAALEKVEAQAQSKHVQQQLAVLNAHLQGLRQGEKKLVLKDQENIYFVKIGDIIRCTSDGPYTHFYLENGEQLLISKTLKSYDKLLTDFGFFRSHHSHLINLYRIKKFNKTDGGYLVMEDGAIVPVSARKKEGLIQRIKQM